MVVFRLLLLMFSAVFFEANAQCKLCDDLRRFHEAHPEDNYEYYEDYLKDQEAKKKEAQKPTDSDKK
jgi:hypothetical protein